VLLEEALDTCGETVLASTRMRILTILVWIATRQGDIASAQAWAVDALKIANEVLGGGPRLALPLEGLAQVATAASQPVQALRLAGAAAGARPTGGRRR